MRIPEFEALSSASTKPIRRLAELAYNLWWVWNPEAQLLFSDIDPLLWEQVYHNPIKFLREVRHEVIDRACEDKDYLRRYKKVMAAFDAYMNPTSTWFSSHHPEVKHTIAYFSAEFGLHESLPIYSGGLGILSGDHTKEASDMGLPLVGVGFIYPQGYFTQVVGPEGWQEARNEKMSFAEVPALPALTPQGREVVISLDLAGRTVFLKVYRIQVGRVPLFLLDTDIHPNAPSDRQLSARLYGGDQEVRISQEIVLGIGGVRALHAMGIEPSVWHMNEGHTAFLTLELARELVEKGLSFEEARRDVRERTVFTTHTPVAAGNDAFSFDSIDRFFSTYWPRLGLDRQAFHNLGKEEVAWGSSFGMTVLALNMTQGHNGVSRLHGEVSRKMWHWLWPDLPVAQTPIGHITNGVHTGTWLSAELRELFAGAFGEDWYDRLDDPEMWARVRDVPDATLWEAHRKLKREMIRFVRARVHAWMERNHLHAPAPELLSEDALTIGFARRFATYKRATLLFSDANRILSIANNRDRPVQFIFTGKAHPADQPGKEYIQRVYVASRHPGLAGRVVFVEDYDMNVARYLVHGVDVWLNTPRRPYEASGTSGMKAALNGAPNVSILDGWWAEGYNGRNGWAIGQPQEYGTLEEQDHRDAESLYDTLEKVSQSFYARDEAGVPREWVRTMKEAIASVGPQFSTRRMLKEYTERLYMPAEHEPISTVEQRAWDSSEVKARAAEPSPKPWQSEGVGG